MVYNIVLALSCLRGQADGKNYNGQETKNNGIVALKSWQKSGGWRKRQLLKKKLSTWEYLGLRL